MKTTVPGEQSTAWIDRLALRECPAITARRGRRAAVLGKAQDDPIVWAAARGANVKDVDGNVYVDMTAGFGVAAIGHAHPAVVTAGQAQLQALPHAMGDAFPDAGRVVLMERLCALSGLDRVIFGTSGSDAVEAALKTAVMATNRTRVLAFRSSYHGLSVGALGVTGYKREAFGGPFRAMLSPQVTFAEIGGDLPPLQDFGAVIIEVVQGRGGIRQPSQAWLQQLREEARRLGVVFIVDEIFTGLGRTGKWWASEGLSPDLMCVGKALGGGFPISACLGTAAAMDAWGASGGEAIHTQTFLGNPVGCAMALAALDVLEELVPTVAPTGERLRRAIGLPCSGVGLMLGVEVADPLQVSRHLMQQGYIALPAGEQNPVLALSPPYTITEQQIEGFAAALHDAIG